jgi:hypothetical protein
MVNVGGDHSGNSAPMDWLLHHWHGVGLIIYHQYCPGGILFAYNVQLVIWYGTVTVSTVIVHAPFHKLHIHCISRVQFPLHSVGLFHIKTSVGFVSSTQVPPGHGTNHDAHWQLEVQLSVHNSHCSGIGVSSSSTLFQQLQGVIGVHCVTGITHIHQSGDRKLHWFWLQVYGKAVGALVTLTFVSEVLIISLFETL